MADKVPNWVGRFVAVVATVAFTLLLIWTRLLYSQTETNRDDITDLTVKQVGITKDIEYLVKGVERLEDKFGTRPTKK